MHYGVLGMRWGIRKDRRKSGSSRKKSTEVSSLGQRLSSTASKASTAIKNQKKVNALKKANKERARQKKTDATTKNVKKMSDAEIKKRIERLQLEKQYKDLSSAQLSRGRKMAADVMSNMLKNSIQNIGTQTLTYVFGTAMNELLADYNKKHGDGNRPINPRKGQKDK